MEQNGRAGDQKQKVGYSSGIFDNYWPNTKLFGRSPKLPRPSIKSFVSFHLVDSE